MSYQDDQKLIEAIQKGSIHVDTAFLMIDREFRPMMHSILQNYSIYSASTREDIIQDTYIKVLLDIRKNNFRREASFKNWMMIILKNKALDFLRKDSTNNKKIQALLAESTDGYFSESHSSMKDDDCLWQALNAFRKENISGYSNLLLVEEKGLNLKQLAKMLDIEHGAARQRISSIRKKLRIYIEDFCGEQK